jgi:hypothetical protein
MRSSRLRSIRRETIYLAAIVLASARSRCIGKAQAATAAESCCGCSYFKTEKDSRQPSNALDSIVINASFNITELDDVNGRFGFEVDLPHRAYYLYAESEADRQRWMEAIKKLKDL